MTLGSPHALEWVPKRGWTVTMRVEAPQSHCPVWKDPADRHIAIEHDLKRMGASVTPPEEFRTAMRGYEKSEVDTRIGQLKKEIDSLRKALKDARSQVISADRAKLQVAGELSEAKQQLKKAANAQPETDGAPGTRIDHLLKIAESQARETLAQATADAETIRNKARADAAGQRARMRTEADDTLSGARSEAEAITSSAEQVGS